MTNQLKRYKPSKKDNLKRVITRFKDYKDRSKRKRCKRMGFCQSETIDKYKKRYKEILWREKIDEVVQKNDGKI